MHQNNYQTKMKSISSTCLADDPCFNLAKWNVLAIHSLICSAPLPYTTPCEQGLNTCCLYTPFTTNYVNLFKKILLLNVREL